MRIVLVGAVESSRVALDSLAAAGLGPSLVVTLPPDAAGRHSDFVDLGGAARASGARVHYATDVNSGPTLEAIRREAPDLCLVIGWSQICARPFLDVPRIGCLAFHPSALPRLRGRAVIPWTILLDERTTGSTLFWLDEGTDSGPIALQRTFALAPDETARSLYSKHVANLAAMLPKAVAQVAAGTANRTEQDAADASFCAKRTADDGAIDWREPAGRILRLIRAVGDPYPGAFSHWNGERLHIDAAELASDSHRYIGLPGQVQRHSPSDFSVRCGDGQCITIRKWRSQSGKPPRLHDTLGRQLQ